MNTYQLSRKIDKIICIALVENKESDTKAEIEVENNNGSILLLSRINVGQWPANENVRPKCNAIRN